MRPGDRLVVGRGDDCDINVPDRRVSRHHAEIVYTSRWCVRDLASSNGTFVDGHPVQEHSITGSSSLRLGDPIDGVLLQLNVTTGGVQTAVRAALTIGRSEENDIVVDDLRASRVHARLTPEGEGFVVVDLGSRNGTFVNGLSVERAYVGPADLLSVGNGVFTVRDQALVRQPSTQRGALTAHALSVRSPSGLPLLDDVGFELAGGSVLAIIGPSGAGKSTLLHALSGVRPAQRGRVEFEGRDFYAQYADLRRRIGVVPQADAVHRQLTVRAAVRFGAELRFPDDLPAEARERRVEQVLTELGLGEHADKRISQLSGGQVKRVSLALELLTEPTLLFLDEPTSGLDPGLDRSVMSMLRRLAAGGRTVVVVTHSLGSLDLCDQVLLLAPGGRAAYAGPPDGLLDHFGAGNHADVFDAVTADPGRWAAAGRHPVSARPVGTGSPVADPSSGRTTASDGPAAPSAQQRWECQVSTLARRQVRVILADRFYGSFVVLLPIVLALLALAVPGSSGLGPPSGRPTGEPMQLLVILVVGAAFMGTAVSARELVAERAIFLRERNVGLSPAVYLGSKLVVFAVICTGQAVLLTALVLASRPGPASGALLPSGSVEIVVAVALTAFACSVVGLLISSLAATGEQVMPWLVLTVMGQLVLCGGLVPVTGRPVLAQLSWLAPARWGYAAAASTADLTSLVPTAPADGLWSHTAVVWIACLTMLLLLTAGAAGTAWRLVVRRR